MEVLFNGAHQQSLNIEVTPNGDEIREAFVADLFAAGGMNAYKPEKPVIAGADVTPERLAEFIKGTRGLRVVERSLSA